MTAASSAIRIPFRQWTIRARTVLTALAVVALVALSFALGHQTRSVTRHVVTTVKSASQVTPNWGQCPLGHRYIPCP